MAIGNEPYYKNKNNKYQIREVMVSLKDGN